MTDDWPEPPVPDLFAEMITSDMDKITLWRDHHEGAVGVEINGKKESLVPEQARALADGYKDSLQKQGRWRSGQSEKVVSTLEKYAEQVEPYR